MCAALPAAAETCAQVSSASCTGGTTNIAVQPISEKGQANGYAGLDGSGKVPSAQLPASGGSEAFPVGSIFISAVSTDPATLLGYGTWSAFGAGRVLVGIDAGQTEFDTNGETGGAKTTTLTTTELPAHTHQILRERSATTGGATTQIARTADTSSTVDTNVNTESTGSGGAFSRLPPYIVVYIWKRDS